MRSLCTGLALAMAFGTAPAAAQSPCRDITFEETPYNVCEVKIGQDLRLFHKGASGEILGSFGNIADTLRPEGKRLAFAMNAGMYHPDRAPVGLLIIDNKEQSKIVTSDGPGNFGLLPNGVFCIREDRFAVVESRRFKKRPPSCRFATQSGPMLVIDGALHPQFRPDSDSRYIRNGVGVSADGQTAYFVISAAAVNFASLARLFRDGLETPNALYFDGKISRLFSPDLGRDDFGFQMGPMVGLVVPQ